MSNKIVSNGGFAVLWVRMEQCRQRSRVQPVSDRRVSIFVRIRLRWSFKIQAPTCPVSVEAITTLPPSPMELQNSGSDVPRLHRSHYPSGSVSDGA